MESRRGTAIPDATVEAGLAQSSESGRLAEWILDDQLRELSIMLSLPANLETQGVGHGCADGGGEGEPRPDRRTRRSADNIGSAITDTDRRGGVLTTKEEKLDLLGGVPLFSDLSKKDLTRILGTAKEISHKEGESIITEGRGGIGFHLITDGKAKVVRGGRSVATLGPGEFFGEMALVDDAPRSASVIAESDLATLVISKWEFRPLVRSNPVLAWKIIEHLVARVREEQTGRDALIC